LGGPLLVPTIYDKTYGEALSESSAIVEWLERQYPDSPTLIPPHHAEEIGRFMRLLDGTLALWARRAGYTQLIMECPEALAALFWRPTLGEWAVRWPLRPLLGLVTGTVLMLRFRFHRNIEDEIYPRLDRLLLSIAAHMRGRAYVCGDRFTAADIALASQLRPLTIVPRYSEAPALRELFAWQRHMLVLGNRPLHYPYEIAIAAAREQRSQWRHDPLPESAPLLAQPLSMLLERVNLENAPDNDQQALSAWRMLYAPLVYLTRLRWWPYWQWADIAR